MPERPADVANRGPRFERAERADLGDIRLAVFFLDVLNHLAAAILAEVDIDIGRFRAADVQKPLEEQIVFQRANVAQIERVGHQRADAGTAGRRRNVALAGIAHEIPDDQKVVRKAQAAR